MKSRAQPKTHLRCEQLVRLRSNPHIGGVKLAKLVPLHIEQLFACLEREKVSARGRQMAGTMLHTALRDAVRLQLIPFNPASGISKPIYAMYVLALDSGMRQGELFALQWSDIDLNTGAVVVQRSLEEINGHHRVKETKSVRGRRRIHLSQFTLDVLHEHRKRMMAEGNASGPVFCDNKGGWLRKGNWLQEGYKPDRLQSELKRKGP